MERSRKFKFLIILIICILVSGLSVGFATFSTMLSINGTANVLASSWEVKIQNLSSATLTGLASEVSAPVINTNDTNIGNYIVSFSSPGDSISYTFEINNSGTFDAEITSLIVPTPTCEGIGDSALVDANNVCSNLSYVLTYGDNSPINVSDKLIANETKSFKLTLTYSSGVTSEELPQNDVAIDNLGIAILYSQD